MADRHNLILSTAFQLLLENTIEKVTMTDVANACGIGVATLYRYYQTKANLVLAVNTRIWNDYTKSVIQTQDEKKISFLCAADRMKSFLDIFIDLYRDHKDILRFNQFFNIYVQSEKIHREEMDSYHGVIQIIAERFHSLYEDAKRDKTLRTDISEEEMFSMSLHIMLAAVTRYAVGLVYLPENGPDPEKELIMLRDMLMKEFSPA